MELVKFLEEVETGEPKEITETYTDEQLSQGGLVKIEAFIRTKTSSAAVRKANQRKREETEGLKTVTVKAPIEVKPLLQMIAKECSEGMTIEEAVKKTIPSVTSHAFVTPEDEQNIKIGKKVTKLSGWKKWIVSKLIG